MHLSKLTCIGKETQIDNDEKIICFGHMYRDGDLIFGGKCTGQR